MCYLEIFQAYLKNLSSFSTKNLLEVPSSAMCLSVITPGIFQRFDTLSWITTLSLGWKSGGEDRPFLLEISTLMSFCFRQELIPGQKNLFLARPLIPSELKWVLCSLLTSDDQLPTVQGDHTEVVPAGSQLSQIWLLVDVVYVSLLRDVGDVPQVPLVPWSNSCQDFYLWIPINTLDPPGAHTYPQASNFSLEQLMVFERDWVSWPEVRSSIFFPGMYLTSTL